MPIDPLPQSLQQKHSTITRSLTASASEDEVSLYAIVDRAQTVDIDLWQRTVRKDSSGRNLFHGQPEQSAEAQAPWLFEIDPEKAGGEFLDGSIRESIRTGAVVWLQTELDAGTLAMRLSKRMTARISGRNMLLRYYDARLFPTLWRVLSDDQKTTFGTFAQQWFYLNADKELETIEITAERTPATDPFNPPLLLTEEQANALLEESERHQLIEFLGKRQPDAFFALSPGDRYRHVSKHDAIAREQNITGFAERLRFCETALHKANTSNAG